MKSLLRLIKKSHVRNEHLSRDIKKILVPINGSEASIIGLNEGIRIAKHIGAKIIALYILDIFPDPPLISMIHTYKSLKKEGDKAIRFAKNIGAKAEIEVIGKVVIGIPATKIIEESKNCDLLVIGARDRILIVEFFKAITYSDVARKVMKKAHCPVCVIKIAKDKSEKREYHIDNPTFT